MHQHSGRLKCEATTNRETEGKGGRETGRPVGRRQKGRGLGGGGMYSPHPPHHEDGGDTWKGGTQFGWKRGLSLTMYGTGTDPEITVSDRHPNYNFAVNKRCWQTLKKVNRHILTITGKIKKIDGVLLVTGMIPPEIPNLSSGADSHIPGCPWIRLSAWRPTEQRPNKKNILHL